MKSDKVLIIRNSALGDVAMTLPVLYSAARKYTGTDFYLLTRPFFAKIFVNKPDNLHIIEADYKGRHKGVKGLYKLICELRGYGFNAVADLHNVLRSWVIDAALRLSGIKVAMVDKKRASRLSTSSRTGQESFIDRYASTLARIGYPTDIDFTSVYDDKPSSPHIEVKQPTQAGGLHPQWAVGIAPFARYANKTYPPELMEQVVSLLTDKGINVYLYGSRGEEEEVLKRWAAKYPNCTSMAGKTDISGELATMASMDVMVTMDSANQHLASITGTPVISVWGSTAPSCGFYGYRQNPDLAICLGLDCQPCTVAGSEKCHRGDMACLKLIKPSFITEKILKTLKHLKKLD